MAETKATILFVDDSITDRTRGTGLIRKAHADWTVSAVSGAKEALELIASEQPDVVVSDLVMPEMDGRELLRILRRDYPLLPVVLVTSQGDDQIAAECVSMGAINYVPKRLLSEKLIPILEEVVKGAEELSATKNVLRCMTRNVCQFDIESDLDQIWSLVNFVRERLHATQLFKASRVGLMTDAVRESLMNAHFHGNLEVNAEPLELPRSGYIAVAASHRTQPQFAGRGIRFAMSLEEQSISFVIQDDGKGFDVTRIADLTDAPQPGSSNGNGVRTMRTAMDSVEWNESGNEVTMRHSFE